MIIIIKTSPENLQESIFNPVVKNCANLMEEMSRNHAIAFPVFFPVDESTMERIDEIKKRMSDCVESFEQLEKQLGRIQHDYMTTGKRGKKYHANLSEESKTIAMREKIK